jgi:hypothetical protein
MRRQVRYPGAQQWFRDWRDTQGRQFCNFYEALISEGEAAG